MRGQITWRFTPPGRHEVGNVFLLDWWNESFKIIVVSGAFTLFVRHTNPWLHYMAMPVTPLFWKTSAVPLPAASCQMAKLTLPRTPSIAFLNSRLFHVTLLPFARRSA
jgi:hypothetical protein